MPRPKSFDPDEKLSEAMVLFWDRGFVATSIPFLEEELGINRFSIYSTFGNKRALFIQALERYKQGLVDRLIVPLEQGVQGASDLRRFFEEFRTQFTESPIPGCLLSNTATEFGDRDPEIARLVEDYFGRLEKALFAGLSRAWKLGELRADEADIRTLARVARTSIQGLLVQLRLSGGGSQAGPTLAAVEEVLRLT
ncbi:MAG: TetR/AcrR family transcriptional regulator [Gemmatimonadota bacterium]